MITPNEMALAVVQGRLLAKLLSKGILTLEDIAEIHGVTTEEAAVALFDISTKILGIDPTRAAEVLMRLREGT